MDCDHASSLFKVRTLISKLYFFTNHFCSRYCVYMSVFQVRIQIYNYSISIDLNFCCNSKGPTGRQFGCRFQQNFPGKCAERANSSFKCFSFALPPTLQCCYCHGFLRVLFLTVIFYFNLFALKFLYFSQLNLHVAD